MSLTRWTKMGCRALELDEEIQPGDWVADVIGETLGTGVPDVWVRASLSVGRTPRKAMIYACRPTGQKESP